MASQNNSGQENEFFIQNLWEVQHSYAKITQTPQGLLQFIVVLRLFLTHNTSTVVFYWGGMQTSKWR